MATLVCALAITLGAQATPASADAGWLYNQYPVTARTTQTLGIVFVHGATTRHDLNHATYYYQFLDYSGRWISTPSFPAFDWVDHMVGRLQGAPSGLTIRVRANALVQAYTTY
jgi:hypothetical protein